MLIASLSDLITPVFLGFKYPNYNHLFDTISTLGTRESPVQKQGGWSLIISGFLFTIFAIGQYGLFNNLCWSHNLYILGIVAFGIGSIIAGIYPEDSRGSKESTSGKIHGIASGLGFLFLIFNPLWAISIPEFNTSVTVNIIIFILGIVSFGIFLAFGKEGKGILKYTGLFQRINLIILYGGLILNFVSIG